jgi:hypothetical protein
MAVAYVGDDRDGRFSAHVECDEDGPFSHVDGPTGVGPEEAIAWARRRAERVMVRVGLDFYTAGSEPVRDLPSWPGPRNDRESPIEPADLSDWQVEARTVWFRDDAPDVARAIARRLDDDARKSSDASSRAATIDTARIANVTLKPVFVTPSATSRARLFRGGRRALRRSREEGYRRPAADWPRGGASTPGRPGLCDRSTFCQWRARS